jgi:Fur family transcriptional regulator, ferric uptake regulator
MPATRAHRVSSGERLNAHARPGRLQAALAKRGVRLTRQRRVLLQVMDDAEQHLDAGAILERAQQIDPRIHRVTVYRTLDMLKSYGLIDELDLLHIHGDQHYYESHGPRDHIHVACLGCSKVREVESALFEQLKRQIENDCKIKITVTRTEIGGYCDECRAKRERPSPSS